MYTSSSVSPSPESAPACIVTSNTMGKGTMTLTDVTIFLHTSDKFDFVFNPYPSNGYRTHQSNGVT